MDTSRENGVRAIATTAPVADIVIPIAGALESVQRCLAAVLRHRPSEGRLFLVNDGAIECAAYLRDLARKTPRVELIEHPVALGQARAINSGLRLSSAPFVLVLGSDTTATANFLAGMLRCAASAPSVGVVGALSNAPFSLPLPGFDAVDGNAHTADEIASIVAAASKREYPRTRIVDLSCLLVAREVLEEIGPLDDATFPLGHGAARDFCLRATAAGFELAVADDVYVQVNPLADAANSQLSISFQAAAVALRRKHGDSAVHVEPPRPLAVAAPKGLSSTSVDVRPELRALRVLFLLPLKGGTGGAHSVVQEVLAMRRFGVDAKIAVASDERPELCRMYREYPNLDQALLSRGSGDVAELARPFNVVVATHYTCVGDLELVRDALPHVLPAYYVQDYEPLSFEKGTPSWKLASDSYRRACGPLFAKSRWLVERVNAQHATRVHQVSPSLERDLFFPDPAWNADGIINVAAMIRPQTRRRGAARTMRVLRELQLRFPDEIRVHLFGCNPTRSAFQALPRDFPFQSHGVLARTEVAALLRSTQVFVDLSDFQPFGRLGLEAMASGCAVVVPAEGGAVEYAVDGENALVLDTSNEEACVAQLSALLKSRGEIHKLRAAGLATSAHFSSEKAALSQLQLFADALRDGSATSRSFRFGPAAAAWAASASRYSRFADALRTPELTESLSVARRKGRKLMREPEAFFADARSPIVRRVGAFVFRR